MIFNRFSYCIVLLATISLLSSCLDSNDGVEYEYSSDAQITTLGLSSSEDSLGVLTRLEFSINQVLDTSIIFNKDSLPHLFDVSTVELYVLTNGASGVKMHLTSPDSTYIWNMTDSVEIKRLKYIEIFAEDGITTKMYTLKLNIHQQDPDTIFWQNVKNNYIVTPTDQVTVSNKNSFFTYYKTNNSIGLSSSPIEDGESWIIQPLTGLPQDVVLKSIQNVIDGGVERWFALDEGSNVYLSDNGINWTGQSTDYPVRSIFGKMPSYSNDSVLAIVKDGAIYKFAKTVDFSSLRILNEIPMNLPVDDFTFTTIKDSLVYTAKYLIVTGGEDLDGLMNDEVWVLQEDRDEILFTSKRLDFNVTGSSLFKYDNKVYLLTSEQDENAFYTSINYGLVWEKASNKQSLPLGFSHRETQSVNVDNKNNIWIFGGVTSSQVQLVDVWKGRINKLFIKQ